MDVRVFRNSLLESVALVESNEIPVEHITNEFGIGNTVSFFSTLDSRALAEILNSNEALNQDSKLNPPRPTRRNAFAGEVRTFDQVELAKYLEQRYEDVLRRTFPEHTGLTRRYLHTYFDSRFSLLKPKNTDLVPFAKRVANCIDFLCQSGISFSMPGAIGENHIRDVGIYLPFYEPSRPQQAYSYSQYSVRPTIKRTSGFHNSPIYEKQRCLMKPCRDMIACKSRGVCLKSLTGPDRYEAGVPSQI